MCSSHIYHMHGLESAGLGQGPVVWSFKHDNWHLSSVKCEEFLDHLNCIIDILSDCFIDFFIIKKILSIWQGLSKYCGMQTCCQITPATHSANSMGTVFSKSSDSPFLYNMHTVTSHNSMCPSRDMFLAPAVPSHNSSGMQL